MLYAIAMFSCWWKDQPAQSGSKPRRRAALATT
jgi:hypothetical protein